MLASSLYVETEKDNISTNPSYDLEMPENSSSSAKLTDDLVELDLDNLDLETNSRRGHRPTTDLVRLYLQEIGRVPLLERDEEVAEAQKVQRHIQILEQRAEATEKGDPLIQEFVELINVHDRLVSQLSHRPSIKRWAKTVGIEQETLKEALVIGKRRWAEIIGCDVKELEKILELEDLLFQ